MNENENAGIYRLPSGYGAVVKDGFGIPYIRVAPDLWESAGTLLTDSQMQPAAEAGNLTTQSEGVSA